MPTFRCVCGYEILVVPDLKAMNRAIRNHVAEHKKASDGSERILALDALEQFLAEQVLIVASENKAVNCNCSGTWRRGINRNPKFTERAKSLESAE